MGLYSPVKADNKLEVAVTDVLDPSSTRRSADKESKPVVWAAVWIGVGVLAGVLLMVRANGPQPVGASERQKATAAPSISQAEFDALSKRVVSVSNRVWSLESANRSAILDATTKNFARLDTNNGTFYVVLDDVTPYLNGQQLTLRMGNPQFATFTGFKMELNWGLPDQNGAVKSKTEESAIALPPGSWTGVKVVLAPATAAEIQSGVAISMTTDRVSLITR